MRRAALLCLTLALIGCDKTNEVDATNFDCGDEAIRCVPCEPGALDCDGARLIQCREEGLGFSVLSECASASLCVDGLALEGGCAEPLCAAGEASCVGAVMQICAAGRHRFDLIPCETTDACLRGLEGRRCAAVECSEAQDCTGEDTQCSRRACVEGRCAVTPLGAATPCEVGGVNGVCDGSGACRATEDCAISADCPGQDSQCRARACVSGACGFTDSEAGAPCEAPGVVGACDGAGACFPVGDCSISADCPGEDTQCRIRVCVSGVCGFGDIPEGTPCEAPGVVGACDGAGACLPVGDCSISSDCPGEDTQCRIRACVGGACGFAELPAGTICDVEGLQGACDGAGRCAQEAECAVATDCGGDDSDCRVRACQEGQCGFIDIEANVPCSVDGLGGVCDGAGGCTITQQCRGAQDCPSEPNPCRQSYCTADGRCATRNVSGSCQMGDSTGECSSGRCRCPNPLEFCANRCVDTRSDVAHCGRCNEQCNTPVGEICDSGDCECPGEYDGTGGLCEGQCVSLETMERCGRCEISCDEYEICDPRGVMRAECECADGAEDCGNGCVPLNTNDNCGACGMRCPSDTQCNNRGQCVCTTSGHAVCSNGYASCNTLKCQETGTSWWNNNNCSPRDYHNPSSSSCGRYTEDCCP